jgi:VWFA-related protein
MNMKSHLRGLVLALAAFAGMFALFTTDVIAAGTGAVTMTVTAVGKKDSAPPEVKQDDIQLYQGKERLQIANWKRGENLFLAILIDDSLDSSIASQWSDLKAFIAAQPPTTYVSVSYARNGSAMLVQDFTNDHVLAAKAIRIPIGGRGAFSSPYLALQDLIKRLPASGERRSILLISSGIDYFRGNFGPTSPDLDTTIEHAQKSNINIWTIYAPDDGHSGRGFFRVSNAQSNLSQLSDETGAESYYLGQGIPVNLKPYFEEIALHLSNQYLLTFDSTGGKKGRFERVRVITEVPRLEFLTPSEVFLPAAQ